ncbi:MAG: hypothetical protein JWQ48_3337 [Conexibacter sp.]|nr:hypothetical protein [Conexibacter sp.]
MSTDTYTSSDASRVKDRAQDVQQQATQTTQARVREQVDVRSTQAGEQVSATARALRSTTEKLREEGQDGPARAAEQLAGRAERVGSYLSESDGERILHDAEEFGRRQPLAVIGLGLVAGMAASRLLKASSHRRYESRGAGMPTPTRAELSTGPTPPVP